MFCRGGDRIRTCASVKEPPCPHGREHHLDLLVVRRLNYACAVSGFCIFSYHSERSSTPPLIGTSLRHGWNFARLSLAWRGISPYCQFCSPFLCLSVGDGLRHSGTGGSLNDWLNAVQSAPVPSESNKSMNSAAPLRAICSAGWYCANDLRGYPALCALHC